ncbi:MAG TPA: hypothetical protein VHQ90_22225 [Thermoanaerobaculia bacterium]|nr:hypothetical protein [Thermoanaerobaculia bacterium]
MSPDSRPDVERVRTVLRHLIDLSGLSRHKLQKRLRDDGNGAYLAGVLNGRLQLKLRHVLDLVRVLDLQPLELFRLGLPRTFRAEPAHPEAQHSGFSPRVRLAHGPARGSFFQARR